MENASRGVGIDFGTTNSAIAVSSGGSTRIARFPFMESMVETFRSVLFFEFAGSGKTAPALLAGPSAIERYLEPHEGGRLIQSLKSFVASKTFRHTQIGTRQYTLEELIGLFLRKLRAAAETELGPLGNSAVVGRPVRFVGAETPDSEEIALTRLRNAFGLAGFDNITFEFEPVGAAYAYAERLASGELVLIADFGGGTSDFSILELGPSASANRMLATAGVPIGGDTFDARIVRHLVSPLLGLGSSYRSMGKMLPVPSSLYLKLESWHHLSFLRSRETLQMIQSLRSQATEPEMLDRLVEIIEGDLGYHLHRSVQRTKVDLSTAPETTFSFSDASVDIERQVQRSEFEDWIGDDLERISQCVSQLLADTGIGPKRIDRVFLTGGSSLVPAVYRIFVNRFGADRIAAGNEFTSVASGLALRAAHHRPLAA